MASQVKAKKVTTSVTRARVAVNQMRVINELDRLRSLGSPFSVSTIVRALDVSRGTVAKYATPYFEVVGATLLAAIVESEDEFQQWQREYRASGWFLRASARGTEIVGRNVRLHIDRIYKTGTVPSLLLLRNTIGTNGKTIRDQLNKWAEEVGVELRLSRLRSGGDFSITGRTQQHDAAVRREFERRRALGVEFYQRDVATSLVASVGLISHYGRVYIREVADEMLAATITNDVDADRWDRDYRALGFFLRNSPRRKELIARNIRVYIERMHRRDVTPSYTELFRLTGSGDELIRRELAAWGKETGIELRNAKAWRQVTLTMVTDIVDPALWKLPLTFLEEPILGKPFNEPQLRMIFNIGQPQLRNTAFMVMAFADRNRRNDMAFFTEMAECLTALSIPDLDVLDADTFYQRYHDKEFLPDHNDRKRATFIQTYFRLIRRQDDYLRGLTEYQRATVTPFLLKKLSDAHFWRRSTGLRKLSEDRELRRKADVAVVHAKFYQLREVADHRRVEIEHICQAYEKASQEARDGASMPLAVTFTEEVTRPGRSAVQVIREFKLWDSESLTLAHLKAGAGDYYDERRKKTGHPSLSKHLYILSYHGSHLKDDPLAEQPYWFIEILEAEAVGAGEVPSRMEKLGLPKNHLGQLPHSQVAQPLRSWLKVVARRLELIFLPLDLLMCSAMLGHSAVQIMTKTGARANEFLQIQLTRTHLTRALLPNGTELIAFYAIAKGRMSPEPFYIDDRCMKALHAWWKYQSDRGNKFGVVPYTRCLFEKLGSGAYLWQIEDAHLGHRNLNAAVAFLLHGLPFTRRDGSEVRLTSHFLRHSFATEMRALETPIDILALLLKQRDVSVTDYYSRPTPNMLAEYQRKIFEVRLDLSRTHRRTPGQIQRQIDDSMSKVGALSPVVGGTCTVANACPAAFACLGCFGNAPDVKKRSQVNDYRRHYVGMAALAETEGLGHENRKALDIVSNCDDMLAEMDSIEAIDRRSNADLSIKIVE